MGDVNPENTSLTLGERLNDLREAMKISQEKVAESCSFTANALSTWETNRHKPDIHQLNELADFYSVSTDYLLGRVKNKIDTRVIDEVVIDEMTYAQFIQKIYSFSDVLRYKVVDYTLLLDIAEDKQRQD